MKVGDLVRVKREMLPTRDRYTEWNVLYRPVCGIIEYITDRQIGLLMISNQSGKPLYKESFNFSDIECVVEPMEERTVTEQKREQVRIKAVSKR